MSAMDAATRNAGDMINRLTIDYNRQRQANKELLDKLLKDQQRLFDDEMRDNEDAIDRN